MPWWWEGHVALTHILDTDFPIQKHFGFVQCSITYWTLIVNNIQDSVFNHMMGGSAFLQYTKFVL